MHPKDTLSRVGKFLIGFFTGAVVLQAAETAAAAVDEPVVCPAESPESDRLGMDTCGEAT
ncbi:MAG: hypothetical protein ABW163_05730 [Luteimonas sp.]